MAAPDLPPPPDHGAVARALAVHLHPRLVAPEAMADCVALVIDNLRASTTIAAALNADAASVRPVLTVEEALALRSRLGGAPLLGGERGGSLVEGFDLDNSPTRYTPQRCRGREVIFTTTNGTAALLHAARASRIIVASLANLSVVTRAVANDDRPIHVLCAGTRDEIGLDDCLPAGAFVERLVAAGRALVQDDSARLCLRAWREASGSPGALLEAMRDTRGGRNLLKLGMDADVAFCATIDALPVVPVFDPATGLITLAP